MAEVHVVLAWLGGVAAACSPPYGLYGFDGWVDGATNLPTDARIVVLADGVFDFTLTRLDTSELVSTTGERALSVVDGQARVAYAPVNELTPGTMYQADVRDDDGASFAATFTTGDGPTSMGLAPPAIDSLDATGWGESDSFYCSIGNPVVERTVTGTVIVPTDLPVGSFVGLRSGSALADFDHVAVARGDAIDLSFVQGEHDSASADQRARRDCLTPVVVLPSGEEIAGDEACVASGWGCTTAGPTLSGVVPLLLLALGVRTPGRSPWPRRAA